MYRCIANLEIDLEGLGEFYSERDESEILNMYQIISAWLQDDLDGPNPENRVFGVSACALDWMYVLPRDISYRNLFDMGGANLVIVLKVLIIYMRNFYKPWRILSSLNLNMSHYI